MESLKIKAIGEVKEEASCPDLKEGEEEEILTMANSAPTVIR